jgi:uncharacterized DUF497 family protein
VLFDGRPFLETVDRASDPTEVRFRRTGLDRKGRLVTLVHTWRNGRPRAITAWRATRDEERKFREEHAP